MINYKKISKIEYSVDFNELTVWFEDSSEPFGLYEFKKNSKTYSELLDLEYKISLLVSSFNEG